MYISYIRIYVYIFTYVTCCTVLQFILVQLCLSRPSRCVAACCVLLQCVTECCRVLLRVALCCSVLQRVAVCCSVLQCVAACCSVLEHSLYLAYVQLLCEFVVALWCVCVHVCVVFVGGCGWMCVCMCTCVFVFVSLCVCESGQPRKSDCH